MCVCVRVCVCANLSSGVKVANGVGLEVTLVLPAQHSGDDEDDERYHADGRHHRGDDPQVVRRVLDHS